MSKLAQPGVSTTASPGAASARALSTASCIDPAIVIAPYPTFSAADQRRITQGLFDIKYDSKGASIAVRAASSEMMLDGATGQAVTDQGLQMGLAELRQRIERALASEGAR